MNLKRTHMCGFVEKAGEKVSVGGFVKRIRDKGGIIFIVLRDQTGTVQLVTDSATAGGVGREYVIMVTGTTQEKQGGGTEILVDELKILSKAQTPPFEITDETKVGEDLRLKYRYLDLRRKELQDNLIARHKIAAATREYFYKNGFIEIETPTMIKSTPEGARDYLVPSRLHTGKFYALPQSPQIYKQLLMISGFDRYIQLARCYRDEDLRADRQPEFTQIDLEMSFVDVADILEMLEGFIAHIMREIKGIDVTLPLPRLTYDEAMATYGSDKPDTRYDMKIVDISSVVSSDELRGFCNAGIVVKNSAATLTRKEIDKLVEYVRGVGGKGIPHIRWVEDPGAPGGNLSCSFNKFLAEGELQEICKAVNCEKGDVALFGDNRAILGFLRTHIAEKYDLPEFEVLRPEALRFNYVWITDMPFFAEADGKFVAMHHPFTCPTEESLPHLEEYIKTKSASAGSAVYAKAYDLVLNGVELLSGSIRITDHELQEKMFAALGLTADEIAAKFGFLVDAYKYACPPHGGAGIGLDRLAMVLCGADSLRDVTAFPKIKDASELMSDCPANVDSGQLEELGIDIKEG
jgi:aspartyl-tRNA synthetase